MIKILSAWLFFLITLVAAALPLRVALKTSPYRALCYVWLRFILKAIVVIALLLWLVKEINVIELLIFIAGLVTINLVFLLKRNSGR